MDYYQGVVIEYLRADRAMFVNTEYCIQLSEGHNPDLGRHWYCDAVACDFQTQTVWLCETTFARPPAGLMKRLLEWQSNLDGVREALRRRSGLTWPIRVWIFVPTECIEKLVPRLEVFRTALRPKVTPLEMVQPWRYHSWDHRDTAEGKPESIPPEMRE